MAEIQNNNKVLLDEDFNLVDILYKVWKERSFVVKACGVALVIGLVVAFSIPKEYTTTITMATESGSKSGGGAAGLGALASFAGINLSSSSGSDALSPELYPDIVKSTPFLFELLTVPVTKQNESKAVTLYEYMRNDQRKAWWNHLATAPVKAIGFAVSLFADSESKDKKPVFDVANLTENQISAMQSISNRISLNVNKKNGLITIGVSMQDPHISSALADTVASNLRKYIVNYRTNKAKQDLAYTEKLYFEARDSYYAAQKKYADFADANRDIVLIGFRSRMERLQNETSLAFTVYNQLSQQLQLAKAKVQEVTPVYTVIQPSSVPLKASEPNKPVILLGFLFLAFVCSTGWILLGKDILNKIKSLR